MYSAASVCLFVCLFVNMITSERVNRMMKLGGKWSVQKSWPSSNLGVLASLDSHPQTKLRRWENQRRLSSFRVFSCWLFLAESLGDADSAVSRNFVLIFWENESLGNSYLFSLYYYSEEICSATLLTTDFDIWSSNSLQTILVLVACTASSWWLGLLYFNCLS